MIFWSRIKIRRSKNNIDSFARYREITNRMRLVNTSCGQCQQLTKQLKRLIDLASKYDIRRSHRYLSQASIERSENQDALNGRENLL